jgi:hypothetical protein
MGNLEIKNILIIGLKNLKEFMFSKIKVVVLLHGMYSNII